MVVLVVGQSQSKGQLPPAAEVSEVVVVLRTCHRSSTVLPTKRFVLWKQGPMHRSDKATLIRSWSSFTGVVRVAALWCLLYSFFRVHRTLQLMEFQGTVVPEVVV